MSRRRECLAGQLAGGAGGPVAALRRPERPGGVEDLRGTGPHGSRTPGSSGPTVGRGNRFGLLALHPGPVRVAAPLVDLCEGLVGLGEPGLLRDRLAEERKGALVALLGHQALGDEQEQEGRLGRLGLERLEGPPGQALVAAAEAVPRRRVLRVLLGEGPVLARGLLASARATAAPAPASAAPRGARAGRPRTSAGVRPPWPAGPAPCTPRRGTGKPEQIGAQLRGRPGDGGRPRGAARPSTGPCRGSCACRARSGAPGRSRRRGRRPRRSGPPPSPPCACRAFAGRSSGGGLAAASATTRREPRTARARIGGGRRTEENGGCGTVPHPPFFSIDRSELHPQPDPELALGRVARGAGDRS